MTSGGAEPAFAAEVAEPIAGVRDAVWRGASGDWAALETRLAPEVAVVRSPCTDTGSLVLIDASATLAWLRERWQPGVEIRGRHVVELCTGRGASRRRAALCSTCGRTSSGPGRDPPTG